MAETNAKQALLASALGFNVNRLAGLLRRRLGRALRHWKLSAERWQVLAAVIDAGGEPLTQNEIAKITLKDRHAVSRMLDGMEEDGWITRTASPDDARASWIRASAKARREFPQVRDALVGAFAEDLAKIPQADRDQLLRLVKTTIAVFEDDDEEA